MQFYIPRPFVTKSFRRQPEDVVPRQPVRRRQADGQATVLVPGTGLILVLLYFLGCQIEESAVPSSRECPNLLFCAQTPKSVKMRFAY